MQTRIQKWGNSLAIRIPKAFALETRLEPDAPVEVTLHEGKIVITPISPLCLEDLLAHVTEDNLHGEQEIGPSVGSEAWP